MKRTYRRRSSHETAIQLKENSPEQMFFGARQSQSFFQPVPAVQRKCEKCEYEDKKVQKKEAGAITGPVLSSKYISNLDGKGKPLSKSDHAFFSSKMNYDFNGVKIHTGTDAADSAKGIHAKAYTVGNNIVFNDGNYNTTSYEGKKLMAHELAHVIQNNNNNTPKNALHRQITTPLPDDAVIDRRTRQARFSINDVRVIVEPDQTVRRGTTVNWRGGTYNVRANGGLTVNKLSVSARPQTTGRGRSRRITGATVRFTLYIKTFYGRSASRTATSAYGRGTTAADLTSGDTSLQFHESRHGQDFQDFISNNPLPVLDVAYPATRREFRNAVRSFYGEVREYGVSLNNYSEQQTDMVGTPMTP